jgi:hypothetical protein
LFIACCCDQRFQTYSGGGSDFIHALRLASNRRFWQSPGVQKFTAATFYENISMRTHPEHAVFWDIATAEDVKEFEEVLDAAKNEQTMQTFLAMHRHLLAEHLGGGHCRWVVPQPRLGAELVPDFLIGEKHSYGHVWVAVELESPKAKAFTKAGTPGKELNQAMRQIRDWREWLTTNINYARNPKSEGGLGFTEIRPKLDGLIIIGRRADYDPSTNAHRQQFREDGIEVHSYEYLLDAARRKVAQREKMSGGENPAAHLP